MVGRWATAVGVTMLVVGFGTAGIASASPGAST
jgi:hypothetical protein